MRDQQRLQATSHDPSRPSPPPLVQLLAADALCRVDDFGAGLGWTIAQVKWVRDRHRILEDSQRETGKSIDEKGYSYQGPLTSYLNLKRRAAMELAYLLASRR